MWNPMRVTPVVEDLVQTWSIMMVIPMVEDTAQTIGIHLMLWKKLDSRTGHQETM